MTGDPGETQGDLPAGDEGGEGTGSGEGGGGGGEGEGGGTPAAEPWKEELVKMQTTMEHDRMQVMAMIAESNSRTAEAIAARPQPAEKEPKAPTPGAEAWELAKDAPQIIPELLKASTKEQIDGGLAALEKRIMGRLNERDAGKALGQMLKDNYEEEIGDRNSEILRAVPEAKRAIEPFLDASVRGTDEHDRIAFLVAAATKPAAVAKRQAMKDEALERSREATLAKQAALTGTAGGRREPKEAKITEADIELGHEFGFDLTDEKVAAEYLAARESEQLAGIDTSSASRGGSR